MNSKRETTTRELAVYKAGDLTPEPWLQQPTETPEAFALFKQFRDMPRRTLRRMHGQDITTMSRICKEFNWHDRCLAYDNMIESDCLQMTKEAVAAVMTKAALANILVVDQIFEIAKHDLGVHAERSREAEFDKVPVMDLKQLHKLLEFAADNLRNMAGLPTETIRVEHSNRNKYDNLSLEEIKDMKRLEDKAAGKS